MLLLAARGHSLTGMDIDIRDTRRFLDRFQVHDVEIRAAQELPGLPTGCFEVITALDVLEHVADLEGTVARLGALLVPGGS
jgi:2-polyprenyl-3-methyl-5-hydroxy-6-metoxy-1,4-benzoquinol methylase